MGALIFSLVSALSRSVWLVLEDERRMSVMQIDAIRELYDYNHWANQRVLSAMTPLTDDMFTRNMGNSFVSLRDSSPISLARNGFGWSDGLDIP